jgi:arylsulfatase A-like enzyme
LKPAIYALLLALALSGCGDRDSAGKPELTPPEPPPSTTEHSSAKPPNLLLVVADDLGFSDLGIYGGEIDTPNLDALARGGVRFTQFYASPMCSPTRAMLLTGVDSHRAGLGNLVERLSENQKGQPGYEGHLNNRVATITEVLGAAGYRTYLTGKWHLGRGEADPGARGFDRYFALMESGAGHFSNMLPLLGPQLAEYRADGAPVESLPDDFYSSAFYVSQLIEYLEQDGDSGQPFFAYLAFTAPHFPLQARRETIEKYSGRYDGGYEAILRTRLERMQAAELIPANATPFPQLPGEAAWLDMDEDERRMEARRMEVYAAMVDDMDRELGRLLEYLEANGELENTAIVFLADNGAEGHYLRWGLDPLVPWAESCCDNSLENMGNTDSYLMLGPAWGRVATTPFRMFKGFTSEGGVHVPALFNFPARFPGDRTTTALASVRDIAPTLLALAGVEAPDGRFEGRDVEPMQGRSLVPLLEGETTSVHPEDEYFGWEIFGKRALRQGPWKIVWETEDAQWWDSAALGIKRSDWQLYNLESDPSERIDLSAQEPRQREEMIQLWNQYASENGVIIPDRQRGY